MILRIRTYLRTYVHSAKKHTAVADGPGWYDAMGGGYMKNERKTGRDVATIGITEQHEHKHPNNTRPTTPAEDIILSITDENSLVANHKVRSVEIADRFPSIPQVWHSVWVNN